MSGPLTGYRIIDFTANMSGPLGTMILGDQGADVIKVEPLHGDVIRTIGTSRGGMSTYFANLNRSKRSAAVDLTTAPGRALAERLIDSADVVVQNFRPVVAERLRLDAPHVRERRPRLVYAGVTGFGRSGPFAGRPAYDHVIQALSGIAARQAHPGSGEPALVRQGIVDKLTGHVLAQAVTAALLQRARTGEGCALDICMLDVAIGFLWPDGMMNHTAIAPENTLPSIANSFRLTRTNDGFVSFAVATGEQFSRLLVAVGYEPDDEGRFATAHARMRHGGEVMREAARRLSEMSTEQVVALMAAHDLPCAPVVSLEDLPSHLQVRANGSIEEFDHPVLGRIRQANPPVDFDQGRASNQRPAPALGQHTVEVLLEIGFIPAEIDSLHEQGIVRSGPLTVTDLKSRSAGPAAPGGRSGRQRGSPSSWPA
jgi:crotonobetainyl-CoA:carnitine CoA-transferase CaiB-like acyl-CoA transferase